MRLVLLVVFFTTVAQAGNRTMCNNLYLQADNPNDPLSVLNWWSGWANVDSDKDSCNYHDCPLCAAPADRLVQAANNQEAINRFGKFFDEFDCWGQPLRIYPTDDPFRYAPSKVDFVRQYTAVSCNTSSVPCDFAYKSDYCPACDEHKMRDIAIAVSITAFVVGIGLGSICGARAQAMSAKAQQQRGEETTVSSSEINLTRQPKSPRRTSSRV